MMMATIKKAPAIRFKGFEEEWKKKKLEEVADFNPKSELPSQFEYVDLESVVDTKMISHRTEMKNTAPSRAQRVAKQGDLFYQTVRPYQRNNYLFELPFKDYVFSTGYAQLRPKIDGRLLLNIVQRNAFVQDVLNACTGTSYPAINSTDLALISVQIPPYETEQTQIGTYFNELDDLIQLQEQKLEKVTNIKKAMLEKMFPKENADVPEIRFKGFTEKWVKKKLGEESDLLTGNPFESKKFVKNGFLLVRGMNVKRGYLDVSEDISEYWPTSKGLEYYLLEENDIVIQMDGALIGKSYAKISSKNLPALLVQRVTRVRKSKADSEFIYQKIQRDFLNYISKSKTETAVPHLSLNDIRNFEIDLPSTEEQQKIGEYFQCLDQQISQSQQKIEQLKHLKQALLQKMFI